MAELEGVSRRRKVFKPPAGKGPSLMLQRIKDKQIKMQERQGENDESTLINSNSSLITLDKSTSVTEENESMDITEEMPGPSNVSSSTDLQEITEKKEKNVWTQMEHNTFYEAIKMVGKDFEGILRYMRKKKIQKDLQQIRVQYHNTFRLYKSNAKISDDEIAHIPRNIFELFIIINGYEWKKKTLDSPKMHVDKFRKLLAEGQVNIRKKNVFMNIKTPVCNALVKFLPEYEGNNHEFIFIHLTPRRSIDYNYVKMNLRQNPKVVIRFKMNDKLSCLFNILEKKWKLNCGKDQKMIELRIAPTEKMNLVDYSSSYQSDGCIKKISLNKILLRKKLLPFNVSSDGVVSKDVVAEGNNIFVYNLKSMSQGICNFGVNENAKISEFYFLCGKQQHIELYYAMNVPDTRQEIWMTFRTFICRKYGEKICQEGRENIAELKDVESEPESATEDDFSNKSDNWIEQGTQLNSSSQNDKIENEERSSSIIPVKPILKRYVPCKSATAPYRNYMVSPDKSLMSSTTKDANYKNNMSSFMSNNSTSSFDCFDNTSGQVSSLIGFFSPCKNVSNQTLPSDYKQALEVLTTMDSNDFINDMNGFKDLYNKITDTPEKEQP
uniref:SANT domain-containing protein n=1 Tax=Parastrongyloides trichosuri TaxID=131310 RepID=A0A0N4ZX54_PARTI